MMRITIQVTCDTPEDAQDAIARLTRPRTWEDDVEARQRKVGPSEARIDQIMAGSGQAAPAHSGRDYAKEPEQRPNVSPGEPSITKIGSQTKATLLLTVKRGDPVPKAWAEHMKLLWSRGEVRFDGTEYYL